MVVVATLKNKASAFQFKVPNALHKEVMKKLLHEFAGKTYYRDIEILVWDIKSLKNFIHSC